MGLAIGLRPIRQAARPICDTAARERRATARLYWEGLAIGLRPIRQADTILIQKKSTSNLSQFFYEVIIYYEETWGFF